ncbi:hypothetical protein [Actinoplanes philippinensis]|uniref:hypothetical protein n=1 Tax=Actinoplanes philippinensis TaxID=35752 RepID=UPI0033C7A82C
MWITAATGATMRRAAWWVLLACTAIGLTSMHTLGHGAAAHRPAAVSPHTHLPSAAPGAVPVGLPAGSHTDDHGSGGHGTAWSVCVAVLTVTLLLSLPAWSLPRRWDDGSPSGRVTPRAPPSGGAGLRLISTSVIRI